MSKHLLQNINDGTMSLVECPLPMVPDFHLLVGTRASLISAGSEKMIIELAGKSLLGKARERPDHVKRVIQKIRDEGLRSTIAQVREKLDEPLPMGYSSAGVVLACGDGAHGFKPGDRVASNGPHAEVACVPMNLCGHVHDATGFDEASFAVVGAIAIHGIRLSRVTLGETVFVIGLGLVGQLAVAFLRATGCRVIGTDPDVSKCETALKMGADLAEPGISAERVEVETQGHGADAVVITAATKSNSPIELAANAVRQKGRIVLVGVVGLELDRRPFYFKEAEFLVSCSYGPGRYDRRYEESGFDYPLPYVRWTEQRNIQAVLDMMATGRLDVRPLISHRFDLADYEQAYDIIEKGQQRYLGIVLQYGEQNEVNGSTINLKPKSTQGRLGIGLLGAGNFAKMVLLPALKAVAGNVRLRAICSAGGVSATNVGQKYGFEVATTDENDVIGDDEVDVVFVLTRHDEHCRQVIKAINAGKHVFVEKPLCLNCEQLQEIEKTLAANGPESPVIMVGFNRRFAPAAIRAREIVDLRGGPRTISIRFNAGPIPLDHWTQDDSVGGGRIIGEACHGIDLATYLAGSEVVKVYAESTKDGLMRTDDQCHIVMRHANGSISCLTYVSTGDRSLPKERVEVFAGGAVVIIEDFRSVSIYCDGQSKREKIRTQDKGHKNEVAAFLESITHSRSVPIPWTELRATTRASFLAVKSLREGVPFDL